MKRFLLVLVTCVSFSKAFTQYNYYRIAVGGILGANTTFADLTKKRPAQTIGGTLDIFATPFTSFGLEFQKGTLAGGDSIADPHRRYFKNNYTSFTLGGKVQLGQVVDFESSKFLYAVRGLYMGLGVGMIKNNFKAGNIIRVQPGTGYVFPGDDKSTNIVVPVNAGINFNILDRWGYTRYILNLNYQFNVTTGEGLDGYNDASRGGAFSNIPDMFGIVSVGLKVCFGPEGLY